MRDCEVHLLIRGMEKGGGSVGVLKEGGRWMVWKESLPGHFVSLVPLATDSGVILFLRVDQLVLTCQKSVDLSQCGAEIIELMSVVDREEGLTRERDLDRL